MFEEALRHAPREELVEHIRLQRELIQRLHRRVLELESTLESAYTCPSAGGGPSGAVSCQVSPSEQERAVFPTNAHHGSWAPSHPRSVESASGNVAPTTTGMRLPAARREKSLSLGERWSTDDNGTPVALGPRRQPPHPHTEDAVSSLFARVASSSQRQKGGRAAMATPSNGTDDAAPAPTLPMRPLAPASAASTVLASSSVDHPTVLEGIKEINYVLAAHRAGRPALPLPVVEELEDIRTRLLRGFKHTHIMSGGDDGRAQEAATVRRAYGALPKGEEAVLREGPLDLSLERRVNASNDANLVCPRWVSPDSSRVVYGTSPHGCQ
ncbi:hypothetical protein GH5_05943 [Leishmania sp. Ghana 2012 LV757]|uniref:hypothetical protein n=1 Tax=Leishmania sp. Ghana 2012 LV757 TaxID=2803181 RepID=UPI001B660DBB|nr:hypothetical protein GH5_05943 [Leishmania sp. Ghana 2012 LV757]